MGKPEFAYPIPDLDIKVTDGKDVRKLKGAAQRMLSNLPRDFGFEDIPTRADVFSAFALRIKPKETEGGLAPFVFNEIQMAHLQKLRARYRRSPGIDSFRGIRDLILKPRQLGFTTYIAALFFMDGLFFPGRNSLVLTHLSKVSQEVLDKYRTFYECLPADIKQTVRLRRASALHLELEFLDSSGLPNPIAKPSSGFMVHTAEGFDLRGLTFQNLHASEAAFYDNWPELTRGVIQSIPRRSGNIFLESTANGFNHYKDLTDAALAGSGYWNLVFFSWLQHSDYSFTLSRAEAEELERSMNSDERELMLSHGATLGQLKWRRDKLEENGGSINSFKQEYPATISEAFISTGTLRFDTIVVTRNLELSKKIKPLYELEEGVHIYADFDPDEIFILCADPAEGITDSDEGDEMAEIGGTDYSAGSVISARSLRTFATIHGKWEPAHFAAKLGRLGAMYDALIVVERNNHGGTVLYALEEAGYPRLYRHLEYDAGGQSYLKLGFPTTSTTKSLVVDALAEVIRRDVLPACEWRFWQECMVFCRDRTGKCGAMPSRHDDRVMSKAIGVYVSTLGAKAWGGAGLVQGGDSANIPRAAAGQGAGAYLASQVPTEEFSIPKNSTDQNAFGLPEMDFGDISKNAETIQLLRAQKEQIAMAPCCGSCLHKTNNNGLVLCGLQRWTVQDGDPACGLWDEKEEENPAPAGYLNIGD
jgi:hypothetical protein